MKSILLLPLLSLLVGCAAGCGDVPEEATSPVLTILDRDRWIVDFSVSESLVVCGDDNHYPDYTYNQGAYDVNCIWPCAYYEGELGRWKLTVPTIPAAQIFDVEAATLDRSDCL